MLTTPKNGSCKHVPIAELRPDLERVNECTVTGIVTLVWPYASSTKSLSLLLVEPDFRLRARRGQVRLYFDGASAKAVSRERISTGDHLSLCLKGATFSGDETPASTPGRGIEWSLRFGDVLDVKIQRESGETQVLNINDPKPSPGAASQNPPRSPSPEYNSHIPVSTRRSHIGLLNSAQAWSSPVFLKREHFLSPSYDPFENDVEAFPANWRRKKVKFGRGSGQWRFAENTTSPVKELTEMMVEDGTPSKQLGERQITVPSPEAAVASGTMEDSELHEEEERTGVDMENKKVEIRERSTPESHVQLIGDNVNAAPEMEPPKEATVEKSNMDQSGKESRAANDPSSPETAISDGTKGTEYTRYDTLHEQPNDGAANASPSSSVISIGSSSSSSSLSEDEEDAENPEEEDGRLVRAPTDTDKGTNNVENILPIEYGNDGSSFSGPWQHSAVRKALNKEYAQKPVEYLTEAKQVTTLKPHAVEHDEERKNQFEREDATDEASSDQSQPSSGQDAVQSQSRFQIPSSEIFATHDSGDPMVLHDDEPSVLQDPTLQDIIADAEVYLKSSEQQGEMYQWPQDREQQNSGVTKNERSPKMLDQQPGSRLLQMGSDQDHVTPKLNQTSNVEIIDLDDDDDDEDDERTQQLASLRAAHEPSSAGEEQQSRPDRAGEVLKSYPDTLSAAHHDEVHNAHSRAEELYAADVQRLGPKPTLGAMQEASIASKSAKFPQDIDQQPSDKRPASLEMQDPRTSKILMDPVIDKEVPKPEQVAQAEAKGFSTVLEPPSIVPNSISHTNEQLLTPSDTQKTSFISQPSALSLRSMTDDDTLSAPNLSQGAVSVPAAPKLPSRPASPALVISEATEETTLPLRDMATEVAKRPGPVEVAGLEGSSLPLPIVDSSEGQSQSLSALRPSEECLPPSNLDTVKSHNTAPINVKPLETKGESSQDTAPDKPASSPPPFSPITPAKKRTPLVEKLMSRRKGSIGTSKARQSSGTTAASRWFAPKRTSNVVPDSEVGSVISESDNERRKVARSEVLSAFATPEKPLAKLIIRSPTLADDGAASVESSQYVPPSQPVTGGLRTSHSYYVPLAGLPSHHGTLTDTLVVAISSTSISRAASGRRDFTQTFFITDYSLCHAPRPLTAAHIFRPRKTVFPEVQAGDAMILRDFKVQSFEGQSSLLSSETSGWVVFRKGSKPVMRGPPVEFGPTEHAFASGHFKWWAAQSEEDRSRYRSHVPEEQSPITGSTRVRAKKEGISGVGVELPGSQGLRKSGKKSDQYSTQALARERSGTNGATYQESSDDQTVTRRRGLRPRNARGKAVSESPEKEDPPLKKGKDIVKHELRDGTEYVDDESDEAPKKKDSALHVHKLRDGRKYEDRR